MTTKRIALYARVSTTGQDTGLQLKDLRAYCEARGFQMFQEYIDNGVSGAKESRPALDNLIGDARKRLFDVVLVWRFDRFARSTKQLIMALEEFRSLGIDFISYQESVDTTSPAGKMLFTMISAFAEFEREIIRERVRAGVERARQKGKRLGRPRISPELFSKAEYLHKQGLSYAHIASKLGISKGTVCNILKTVHKSPSTRCA